MKSKLKALFKITFLLLGFSAFCLSTGFAWYIDDIKTPKTIQFKIINTHQNQFLQESDIRNLLQINSAQWQSIPKNIVIKNFEQVLKSHGAVQRCNVYTTHSGIVCVEALSKTPVMRIQDSSLQTYYIDVQGKRMSLSDLWTARVPLVNGYVSAQDFVLKQKSKGFTYATFCTTLFTDSLFKQLIHQVYIDSLGQLVLTPIMGAAQIIMDTSSYYPLKLEQLRQFYTSVISKSQHWNTYSSIDLRFANQIIAIAENPLLKTDTLKHHE
jgi:cell division protein FtsQ